MSIDIASLVDIREAIDRALFFVSDLAFEGFVSDERTKWAVYSQVIIIGEATSRISRDFQQNHPAVPWRKMIAMRHRIVHGYDEVDWRIVWDTVIGDLPRLRDLIRPLIPAESEEPDER